MVALGRKLPSGWEPGTSALTPRPDIGEVVSGERCRRAQLLNRRPRDGSLSIDLLLQDRRRLEHEHPARQDRHLGAGLRVAALALTFLAYEEGSER